MKCPFCDHGGDRVVDSRESRGGGIIRRRRECLQCGKRFTSYETVEEVPLMVLKKNGERAPFDRAKVLSGLKKACDKRVAEERMDRIADRVAEMVSRTPDRELPTGEIGEIVMQALKKEDEVAYVRFASVYRDFRDTQDFVQAIDGLIRRPGRRS